MHRRHLALSFLAAIAVAALAGPALAASSPTQTLKFYDKPVSLILTKADGTKITNPSALANTQPAAGDTLDVNSLDYAGNHEHHARRWTASTHTHCAFTGQGAPTCTGTVAYRNSLLEFSGNPGTLVNATGAYQGATGRILSNIEVGAHNESDIVVKVTLKR